MKCTMCKERDAEENGVFCTQCAKKIVEAERKRIEESKMKAYVVSKNLKILKCDVCGCYYLSAFDNHTIGEKNVCCDHCVWVLSHDDDVPQPQHTCRRIG